MTEPMTPADCDLRDFPFMQLSVGQLLDSETWMLATGDEAKAAVTLWCKSWHQVPASSLPNNERLLATLSGAGAKWKKVREVALRGFVLCSDGRLYHRVIAEKALEAWSSKLGQRARTAKATTARWNKGNGRGEERNVHRNGLRNGEHKGKRDGPVDDDVTDIVTDSVTLTKGEGERQGKGESQPSNSESYDPTTQVCNALGVVLKEDVKRLNWPRIVNEMIRSGLDLERDILPACTAARERGIPNLEWVRKRALGEKGKRDIANTQQPPSEPFEDTDEHGWRQRVRASVKIALENNVPLEQAWPKRWGPILPEAAKLYAERKPPQ